MGHKLDRTFDLFKWLKRSLAFLVNQPFGRIVNRTLVVKLLRMDFLEADLKRPSRRDSVKVALSENREQEDR